MRAIWKYPLRLTDRQVLQLPIVHQTLSVGLDPQGNLCLWALVDPTDADRGGRWLTVFIVGTGNPADHVDGVPFLGTVTMPPFVWHIFAA